MSGSSVSAQGAHLARPQTNLADEQEHHQVGDIEGRGALDQRLLGGDPDPGGQDGTRPVSALEE